MVANGNRGKCVCNIFDQTEDVKFNNPLQNMKMEVAMSISGTNSFSKKFWASSMKPETLWRCDGFALQLQLEFRN